MSRQRGCILLIFISVLAVLGVVGVGFWRRYRGQFVAAPLPDFPPTQLYTPWPTPQFTHTFDFPLLPAHEYGPYVRGDNSLLTVDTRYGAQNPALGIRSNCFRDAKGNAIPFSKLYHAGVDLFGIDDAGQAVCGKAKHAPVHAVADGVILSMLNAGAEGQIIIIEHLLTEKDKVYSVYWHVSHPQVQAGQPVDRGQVIAVIHDMGCNSHLHWEMRTFRDGTTLFPKGTAGERGSCNGHIAGVGYTWDDDPSRARPDFYGYLDPMAFVEAH